MHNGKWVVDCSCPKCNKPPRPARRSKGRRSGWTPRTTGSMDDGTAVTFRQGTGDNEGHTLISDGEKSARQFDAGHNHYGPNREDDGYVDGDRGHYSGPGS